VRRSMVTASVAATVPLLCLVASPLEARQSPAVGFGNGRIVFTGETADDSQLWTIWPNGTHAHQITHTPAGAQNPDWSPDSRHLVFAEVIPGTDELTHTAFVNADGSHLRTLPKTLACGENNPSYFPDGRSIVYVSWDCADDTAVFRRDIDGSHIERITPPSRFEWSDPNVSPDGTRISYVQVKNEDQGLQALTVSDVNGEHFHRLTPYSFDVFVKQAWSPDSKLLAFTMTGGDGPANICLIRPDGSHLRCLTHLHNQRYGAIVGSFSPDGRWLAYRFENTDNGHSALWRMHVDGTHRHRIWSKKGLTPRYIEWGSKARPCK
jgi:Tol biopolymer transport system component